jgi:hypothetical protein
MSEGESGPSRYDEEFLKRFNARPKDEFVVRHLLLAVPSSQRPLDKINLVCQAAMLYTKEEQKKQRDGSLKVDITGGTVSEDGPSVFDVMSSVSLSLSYATKSSLPNGSAIYYVPWMFSHTDDGYTKYVRDMWLEVQGGGRPKLMFNIDQDEKEKPDWELFFDNSKAMPEKTYNALKAYFLEWALPKAMTLFSNLLTLAAHSKETPEGSAD